MMACCGKGVNSKHDSRELLVKPCNRHARSPVGVQLANNVVLLQGRPAYLPSDLLKHTVGALGHSAQIDDMQRLRNGAFARDGS